MGRQLRRPPVNAVEPRQRFLIVCEGSKTEPHYFEKFRVSTDPLIKVIGAGNNTINVIETAIKIRVMVYTRMQAQNDYRNNTPYMPTLRQPRY